MTEQLVSSTTPGKTGLILNDMRVRPTTARLHLKVSPPDVCVHDVGEQVRLSTHDTKSAPRSGLPARRQRELPALSSNDSKPTSRHQNISTSPSSSTPQPCKGNAIDEVPTQPAIMLKPSTGYAPLRVSALHENKELPDLSVYDDCLASRSREMSTRPSSPIRSQVRAK